MVASLEQIERFLVEFGDAMSAGDGARVATMWSLPALVVSDEGSRSVETAEQVAEFFSAAPEQYRERGIASTRPEHVAIEHLSDRLCSVDVRWLGIDAEGHPIEERELSSYLLRTGDDGQLLVQVAIARPSRIPAEG